MQQNEPLLEVSPLYPTNPNQVGILVLRLKLLTPYFVLQKKLEYISQYLSSWC
jgi:hypothetical protein